MLFKSANFASLSAVTCCDSSTILSKKTLSASRSCLNLIKSRSCSNTLTLFPIKNGSYSQANDALKKAQYIEKNLVRTSLLNGKLEYLLGNYKQAIKSYKKVSHQNSDYLSEIIKPLFK